jgi:hypothetical protein
VKSFIAALRTLVLPFGQTIGQRIVINGINGTILVYNSVNRLIASIAPETGVDQAGNEVQQGIASYSSTLTSIIAILNGAGSLEFAARSGNDPFLVNGLIAAGNPGIVNTFSRASLMVRAPGTRNGGGTNDGVAEILLESTSADGTRTGKTWYWFDSDVNNVGQHIKQGFVYAGRWDAAGNTVDPEVWKPVTLPGGWTATQPCSYRLMPDGFVQLKGIAQAPGPIAPGTVLTTLPVGYRPVQNGYAPMMYDSAAGVGRLLYRANGALEIYDALSVFPVLDSIRFSVPGLL